MNKYIEIAIISFGLILAACKSDQENSQTEMKAAHGGQNLPEEISYKPAAGWIKEQPRSSMRKDQYRLPGHAGAGDAELSVFVFPGSGGAVQSNIDRWLNQFTKPDGSSAKEKAEIQKTSSNGLPVTMVYVTGTYLPGAMGGPMSGSTQELPGYAMMAAIVETSGDPWFFKTVGPQTTIDHWRSSFETFMKSVSLK